MNTYTNLTIIFKNQININNTKINISNALIIFEKVYKNIVNIGIYPTGDNVVVSINGTEKILDVANICNINYINSYNYSQSIFINVSSTCSNLNEYINGMRVPINSVYRPPYSGIYYVILTNGS
ncbi:MAG: Ig-like domain repeat protein, partial [Thermoproteus sp.]